MTTRGRTNNSVATKRLQREYKEMTNNPPPLATAQIIDENLTNWIATIEGPPGTPYEGGKFKLSLRFPPDYPFEPPQVTFITKIYHSNISTCGRICLDILSYQWSPAMTVQSLLLSICSLLADCNPNSPLRQEIARLYKTDREEHDRRAREYTRMHAMG